MAHARSHRLCVAVADHAVPDEEELWGSFESLHAGFAQEAGDGKAVDVSLQLVVALPYLAAALAVEEECLQRDFVAIVAAVNVVIRNVFRQVSYNLVCSGLLLRFVGAREQLGQRVGPELPAGESNGVINKWMEILSRLFV